MITDRSWRNALIIEGSEFLLCSHPTHYPLGMPDTSHLRPATAAEIADALSFALRYQGRKRVNHADDMMARITADRLVQHLTASGFVLMKGTAAAAPSTSAMPSAERD